MPRVPYTAEPGSNVTPMVGQIDPTTLAMAAGMMYQEGKLFEPEASFNERFGDPKQFVKEVAKDEWPLTQIGKRVNLNVGLEAEAGARRMMMGKDR